MTFKAKKITRVKFREYVTPPNTEHRVDVIYAKPGIDIAKRETGIEITVGGKSELYPWGVVKQVRTVEDGDAKT